jgi:hypothetical protein
MGKLPHKSDRRFGNRLYHQNTDGTFTDVAVKAGLTGMAQNYYTMGVAVGNYDNDGFDDIYVTGYVATRSTTTMETARSPTSRSALEFPLADGARAPGFSIMTMMAGRTSSLHRSM